MDKPTPQEAKQKLEKLLIVGAKIKIGKRYAQSSGMKEGEVITLVNGTFEYDNGLYTEGQYCPAIWNERQGDYDSIYHLFENNLSGFMDCEILTH